jgi:hypothetical protein
LKQALPRAPSAHTGSIHELLAYIATQPGVGCWRACNLLSFSLFFTLTEVFALLVFIADDSGLTSYADARRTAVQMQPDPPRRMSLLSSRTLSPPRS